MSKKLYASFIYAFLYIPILILIVYSFNDSKYSVGWKGFTLEWYSKLFENESLIEAALHTLHIAFISASAATIIGALGAISLYRFDFFGKKFLNSLIYILIMSPEIVMGISLLMLFIFLSVPLGFWTLFIAHITFCVPFVIVTIMARMNGFDMNIIEAGKDLGANEWIIFKSIILPNIMPALIAGFLLAFTLSLDDVIISFFVTGPDYEILPLKIYSMVRLGVKPEINALSAILFAVTLFMVLLSQILTEEE